jgi:hypothetical protein
MCRQPLPSRTSCPLIRRDPNYVARQNFKLFRDGERGATRVDPLSVDWSAVGARNFPYRLRQDPGPRNALGRVKFMFPNAYHVYLHDTPARELFAKTERAFSSGCIRLEKPIELAEYLLRDDPRWSRQRILATIARGEEQVVHLPTTIPVHLLYWTAWVNEQGLENFRKDIYKRDKVFGEGPSRVVCLSERRGSTCDSAAELRPRGRRWESCAAQGTAVRSDVDSAMQLTAPPTHLAPACACWARLVMDTPSDSQIPPHRLAVLTMV